MRVTRLQNYRHTTNQIRNLREREATALQQISSGRELLRASDNPDNAVNAQRTRSVMSRIEARVSRATSVESRLASYDVALSGVGEIVGRLHQLGVQMANDTYNVTDRLTASEEVEQLLESLRAIANTREEEQYIFSGTDSATQTIDAAYTFQGNNVKQEVDLGNPGAPSTRVEMTLTGDEVFFGAGGGVDIITAASDFVTALQANDLAGIQTAVGEFLSGVDQTAAFRARIGATMNRVADIGDRNQGQKIREAETLSGYVDADIAETATELAQAQFGLQAAMTATSRISEISLLDFI